MHCCGRLKSPQQFSYRVGLPRGATLVQSADGSGAQIVDEGVVVATVPTPSASDAAGVAVPVSMSISDDVLTVTVDHPSGAFQYPIELDPEVKTGSDSTLSEKTWIYGETPGAGFSHNEVSTPRMTKEGASSSGQRAEFYYKTEGVSKIYKLNASAQASPEQNNYFLPEARVYFEFEGSGGYENSSVVASTGNLESFSTELCASSSGCSASGGAEHNLVRLADLVTGSNGDNKAELPSATVSISEPPEFHATASYNTQSPEINGTPNVFYTGGWMGPDTGAIEYTAEDNGIGVSETELTFSGYLPFYTKNYLSNGISCAGIQCAKAEHEVLTYERFKEMPPGEQKLIVSAHDAIEHTSSAEHGEGEHLIKLDGEPPYGITLSGLPNKNGVYELGEVEAHLKAEATDGEAPFASSGVKSIAFGVDGKEIGKPSGSCPLGPCTASAEWSLNGAELGVGTYTLTVVATDNVGNVAEKSFTLHVYHASPVTMGPGSVNPESGDFALGATDVNLSGGSGSLAVTRHYDSRNLKEGEEGPLGPQWTVSLGSLASLEVLPDGSVMVVGPEGLTFFKAKTGGGFEAPAGDSNLTLEHTASEYLFKDAGKGTTTRFTLPSGAKAWMPTVSEGLVSTDTTTDTYVTAEPEAGKKIVEPKLELAPHASASCPVGEPAKWQQACRGLEFEYGTKTKENIGENESEWGEYEGRLMEVKFVAYEASSKKIVEKAVAKYEYDKQGRLRSEWDPEVSPPLKLVYGYDAEGHVTAITPPGEESYAFTYGAIPGDSSTGRLLKVTRAQASAPLWNGSLPVSTAAPQITGTPMVGERLAVSNGTWSGEPVVFGYQWEDCNSSGKECTAIPGATNADYTPENSDASHALVVLVAATNGGGSTVVDSVASPLISTGEGMTAEYSGSFGSYGSGAGQFKEPVGLAVDGSGNVWVADWANSRFEEFRGNGEFVRSVGVHGSEPGQVEGIEGITVDPKGNVWIVEGGDDRVEEFTSEGVYVKSFGSPGSGEGQFHNPSGLTVDTNGNLFVADRGNHRVEELNAEGKYVRSFTRSSEKEGPFDVQLDANGDLWVSYAWEGKIAEFSPQGSLLREWGTKGTGPGQLEDAYRLQIGPEGNIWLAEWGNNRVQVFSQTGEYLYGFGTYGSGEGQFWHARGIGFYNSNVYVLDSGEFDTNSNNRIEKWQKINRVPLYSGSFGSYGSGAGQFKEPVGLAVDGSGNVWVADWANSRFEEFRGNGEFVRSVGVHGSEPGQVEGIEGITVDPKGNVWIVEGGDDRVEEFTSEGVYVKSFGSPGSGEGQFHNPSGLTVDTNGNLFVADRGNHRVEELNAEGKYVRSFTRSSEKEGPFDVQLDANGDLWVSYAWEGKIAEFSPQGSLLREWGTKGTSPGQLEDAYRLQIGPEGNIWLAEWGNNRVQVFSQTGEYLYGFGTYGSGEGQFWHARGIGFYNSNVYVLDSGEFDTNSNNRVEKWQMGEAGELHTAQPGSTIEYNVPLAGVGLPSMTSGEVSKWGEKDDPVYATAIFPPDEPQGWPASDYRRAHISYFDSNARAVNIASPSGGISTQEYNEGNQVTRTLSADNRDAALKESCESETKCKSAEAAKLLTTENAYDTEGQLTDAWGPQHTVRLAVGKEGKAGEEALARNHVHYYYDEGAKEAEEKWHETYNLVTKTVDGAETASKEEFDKRTVTTSYSGQGYLGWKLRTPTSTTTDPGGLNLTSTTVYEESTGNIIETRGPAASGGDANVPPAFASQFGSTGFESGKLNHPMDDAVDTSTNLWVVDGANNRLQKFSGSGAFIAAYGKEGSSETELQFKSPVGIAINQKTGNIYVGDQGNNRIVEMSSAGAVVRVFGKAGSATGEFKEPEGVAIDSKGNVWVADSKNNRVQEFNEEGKYVSQFGTSGTGCGQFSGPADITIAGEDLYVTDEGNSRVEEFNEEGKKCLRTFGSAGAGGGQFKNPTGIAVAPSGTVYVSDSANARVEEFTATGAFLTSFGAKGTGYGQFAEPQGLAFLASGDLYIDDAGSNNRVQQWVPAVTGSVGATAMKTVYYTAKAEAEVPACREHPEWTGLLCQARPVAQPGISGLPELPVTTFTYNVWNQPEKTVETFGSTTRTKKTSYDAAGRPLTSEETSSTGAAMPTVTDKYNTTTGVLEAKSTTVGETTKTLTSKYNTLGQLETYTDAEGKTTTFEYEKAEDSRIIKVSDAKGSQTYAYDETTGALKELVNSAAGTFRASYDVAGRMTSESYPNGMTAYYTYNPAGEATGIEYKKLTHCTEKCTWFSDTTVSSIHGETLKQTNTLAEEPTYTYDAAGRLTQVQEIPAGEGCKTRIYVYDESSNRTTETTREPGTEGKCASEGGSTEWHTYDTANSLTDPGVSYDVFGDTIKLPAADAGGSELLSEYYLDGQVHVQEQNKEKIEYKLDPEERTLETISSGNTAGKLVAHYDGPGGALAWKGEGSGESEKWTRNIPGIDGTLTASQTGEGKTGHPAVLLLHDLQGNVVGEAAVSETETKLLKTYDSTEFGVPNNKEAPPTYAWLGAAGVASELPSGVITQDGITYVPQTGRPLQTEGVAVPSPGNAATPFTRPIELWVGSKAGEGAARELSKAEQEKQEREIANTPPGTLPSGNPGWWCGEEYGPCEGEEGEYEEGGESEEGSSGGPVATIAVRMPTPEGRFAEAQCDKERDTMENKGYEIGNFTGRYTVEPGGRYEGTSYELLYATSLPPFVLGMAAPVKESVCHVIIDQIKGKNHVTHKAHFRLDQSLRGVEA